MFKLFIFLLIFIGNSYAQNTPVVSGNQFGTNTFSVLGNIGIGSSAPGETLDVNGTIRATNYLGVFNGLGNGNWVNITQNPGNMGATSLASTSIYSETSRTLVTVPKGITIGGIAVVYGNYGENGSGWTTGYNPIRVKASVFALPSSGLASNSSGIGPIGYLRFGNSESQIIGRGKVAIGYFNINATSGQQFYIHSYADSILPAAPIAPTATGNTGSGSSFTSGQLYGVGITYDFGNDLESYGSPAAIVTISSNGNNIVVTSPSNPLNGARGYKVWVTQPNQSTSIMYATPSGTVPFGTNITLTAGPNITGGSGMEGITPTANSGTGYIPGGWYPAGGTVGTQAGASGSGESTKANIDYTDGQFSMGAIFGGGGAWGPIAILANATAGVVPSVATGGDSINQATFDSGYNNGSGNGGWQMRAILGQTTNRKYNPAIVPTMGVGHFGIGGETMAAFASSNGNYRSEIMRNFYTSIWLNYGTNDLSTGSPTLISNALISAARFTTFNKYFYLSELFPRGGTTDGYQTLVNQTLSVGATGEATRRAYNNWGVDNTGAGSVTEANLFRSFGGSAAYNYNVYGGGDGSITSFYFKYPALEGSESITNGGSAATFNGSPSGQLQYSYLLPATINGSVYASGIQFGSAPTSGNAIAATYTKIAGFVPLCGSLCTWVTGPSAIEVDGNGNPGVNGGFVKTASALTSTHSMTSAPTSTTFTDNVTTATIDQWAGYVVYIVADSTTPTAVGEMGPISDNTASASGGVYTISSWSNSVTPDINATYFIYDGLIIGNGPHPSTGGHMLAAQAVNTSLFK